MTAATDAITRAIDQQTTSPTQERLAAITEAQRALEIALKRAGGWGSAATDYFLRPWLQVASEQLETAAAFVGGLVQQRRVVAAALSCRHSTGVDFTKEMDTLVLSFLGDREHDRGTNIPPTAACEQEGEEHAAPPEKTGAGPLGAGHSSESDSSTRTAQVVPAASGAPGAGPPPQCWSGLLSCLK